MNTPRNSTYSSISFVALGAAVAVSSFAAPVAAQPEQPPALPSAPEVEAPVADTPVEPAPQAPPPPPEPVPEPAAPVVAAPPPVAAPETPEPAPDSVTPLKVSGSFFSRYELRDGYAEQGLAHPRLHREGDNIVYRARLGLKTNPVSVSDTATVSATLVPQASGTHSTQGAPATIGDAYDLGVYEAYVRLAGEHLTFDFGRFEMNYGDALVIGNLGWNEAARAFQGGRVRYGSEKYWVDFFATLISEGRPATGEILDGDRYFYGAYAALGPLLGQLDFDVYLLGLSTMSQDVDTADPMDPAATANIQTQDGASEFTLGARAKQKLGTFDYRAEAGVQFGTTQAPPGADPLDKSAYHLDAGVGISPAPGLRIGVGGLVASGDSDATDDKNDAWNQLFPTAHKFLGLSDVFGGRSNVISGNAQVKYKASDSLILKVDGHLLSRMEENDAGETFVGTEIDTNVIHPIGKGAALRGMYAVFLPNTDYWPADDTIHFFELQFGYNFK